MMWIATFLALVAQDALPAPVEIPVQSGVDLAETARDRERPEERIATRLSDLQAATSEEQGEAIASEILSMWRQRAGPTAELLLSRGADAEELGDLATAARQYTHLRRLEPDFATGWLVSARVAAASGDWGFALEALERAIALDPNRFDAYAMLGRALEQADAPQAAMEAYEAALRLHPNLSSARSGKARLERIIAGRAL